MLVAHRGGARLAPENTLVAFRQARERWWADMLEMDVHLSRDGQLMVIHDASVDRTTDGSGPVAELTLEEIQALDAGDSFEGPSGGDPFRGQGLRVPTLEEVIMTFTDVWINVECKAPRAARPLADLVTRMGAQDRVLIAAEAEATRRAAAGYRGPWGASRPQAMLFWVLHRLPGGSPYTPAADILQVPQVWKGLPVVTRRFIREAQRLNIPVQAWTVDDEDDMRRLLDWGIDGIQTDRPDVLARLLSERSGRAAPPGLTEARA
jgi:glycerophosphoryl diester phosphodiesterase